MTVVRFVQSVQLLKRGGRSVYSFRNNQYVLTGDQSGNIFVWEYRSNEWTIKHDLHKIHKDAVMSLVEGPLTDGGEHTFYSGSRNGVIKWTTISGKLIQVISVGYAVSSLCTDGKNILYSGDWNGRCIAWDISTGQMLAKLVDCHRYAVTCTTFEKDGKTCIVTGSQNGSINFWDGITENKPFHVIEEAHRDIIRVLIVRNNILYSCSNDGHVNETSVIDYRLLRRNGLLDEFIFAMTFLDDQTLVVGGDSRQFCQIHRRVDGSWKSVQSLRVGSEVWGLAAADGYLFIVTSSGHVTIWSTHEEANPEGLKAYEAELDELAAKERKAAHTEEEEEELDIEKLPMEDQRHLIQGKSEGQHGLFKQRGTNQLVCYIWSKGKWELVGNVLDKAGSSKKNFYEGDSCFAAGYYDHVFSVEVGENGELKKLPFNVKDSPMEVAETFCAREQIGRVYVPQIVEFIQTNSNVEPPTAVASTPSPPTKPPLPSNPILYQSCNVKAVKAKLLEFNNSQPEENRLCQLEQSYLDNLLQGLADDCSVMKNRTLRKCELDLVFESKLNTWPDEAMLPVFDLRRIVALNPGVVDYHKGWTNINFALTFISKYGSSEVKPLAGAAECAAKFLANLMSHPTVVQSLEPYITKLTEGLPVRIPSGCRANQVRMAVIAVIHNLSFTMSRRKVDPEILKICIEKLSVHLIDESDDGYCLMLTSLCHLISHTSLSDQQRKSLVSQIKFMKSGQLETYLTSFL